MIALFAFVPRMKNIGLRRFAMILVAPFAVVEGALNGVIGVYYGYRHWWSYVHPTETENV